MISLILIILLTSLVVSFWVIFIIFCYFFILHLKNKKKLYAIKENFNNLTEAIDILKFKHLSVLSKNNIELKKIYGEISSCIKLCQEKLRTIKNNIFDVTELLSTFNERKTRNEIKFLIKDLKYVDLAVGKIRNIYKNVSEGSQMIADALISYRENSADVVKFYEHNLCVSYDNEDFKETWEKILALLVKINTEILENAEEETKSDMLKVNYILEDFFNKTKNFYVYDKALKYVRANYNACSKIIKKDGNKFAKKEKDYVEEKLLAVKSNNKMLEDFIKIANWDKSKKYSIVAIKNIEEVRNSLETNESIELLLQENIKICGLMITNISNSVESIGKLLNFQKNTDDVFFIRKSEDLINEFKVIKIIYNEILSKSKIVDFLTKKDLLNKTISLIDKLNQFDNNIAYLSKYVLARYTIFIKIISMISSIKFYIAQIDSVYLKNIKSQKIIDQIKFLNSEIKSIEEKMNENFNLHSKSIHEELTTLSDLIKEIFNDIVFNTTIKKILRNLIFFTTKFKNEEIPVIGEILSKSKKYYEEGKYIEGIDLLTKNLLIIKKNAADNGINII